MRNCRIVLSAVFLVALMHSPAIGEDRDSTESTSLKQRLIDSLPPAISDGLDVDAWGWLSGLQTSYENQRYYDAELGLGIVKSFNQTVAFGTEGNFIDANGHIRFELQELYTSIKVCDEAQTVLTIGQFNAGIGVEGRNFWDRRTGTTSLLFAAKPQDLLGVMVTQPIGQTGLTVRPFITEGFQAEAYDFNQSPSAGVTLEYKPSRQVELAVTNWVGPGMVFYDGQHMHQPFPRAYGGGPGSDPAGVVVENWEGPNFYAERGGTLYFVDGSAIIRPDPDLTLSAEALLGTTPTSEENWGWGGFMVMADYQFTDALHLWGRSSWLEDSNWLVTGVFQRCQEISCGAGYTITEGVEVRAEYRHDFSSGTPDFDTVSLHLTFTY